MVIIWGKADFMSNHTKAKTENRTILTDFVHKSKLMLSAVWLIKTQRSLGSQLNDMRKQTVI